MKTRIRTTVAVVATLFTVVLGTAGAANAATASASVKCGHVTIHCPG
ncbi:MULTISPECIES: hypothetical protein [Rhodococcus]|uniref:Uncharacterized protein n=1 Tax=Rhodococcus aetherivorans TaxID=191292 RepID=A0ABQ0YNG0_9NOCA|nr:MULTISPECIES: hypothetical protein [Rhodococcus]ETT23413.1 hypothetical protein RR21198_5499 [Rhodococcus rhodochrous ATCC 21198]NCL77489.1 hypothetical protein [Rhodococcus sp. YH1]MBC2589931.1 hypothetical protein [Rhodococcus aetherivorans]MDV6292962.1 hypothetical protein [Rhodococcus aetherivorans]NGP04367.1 hypothetical protein [Rhodococcus sp. 14C212]